MNIRSRAKLHIKPTILSANILDGLIFGAGFALLGFCPGTCAGAAGEGCLDGLYSGVALALGGAICPLDRIDRGARAKAKA